MTWSIGWAIPAGILVEPLPCHPSAQLDRVERLSDGVVQLPRQPLPLLQRDLLAGGHQQPGVCSGGRRLVRQRGQEGRLRLVRHLALPEDGGQEAHGLTAVEETRDAGRLPREVQGACAPERPLHLLPPIRVDDDRPRHQDLLVYEPAGGRAGPGAQVLPEFVRHTRGTDPSGEVVFIIELHPCGERTRSGERAFADGLEDCVDRVVGGDAGGGLS